MKKQQGFTLIELMIVVAIVAILAAIALPAYQDYMKRSKVSEAVATAGACKTSVAEYAAATSKLPADINAAGCSNVASQYVSAVNVTKGVIDVTLQGVGTGVDGKKLTLTPTKDAAGATAGDGDNIVGWKCSTDAEKKFVPGSCRG
ncbi:pilin [Lysobacter auxotrophicus]|uniref:Pilin n=1 Tax=Lysobacter auxotrophicus TaxID=2992573 RepID=A0ABN6UGX7_9GAMM|nr:pilin [Lysobacter auxotrophicus]BDU15560.1 pilin [Lysobacter auxotrophicus]